MDRPAREGAARRGPGLEIVVPARNEAGRLPGGLTALCAKAAALPVPASVIVVDSASTDATAQIVENWPAGPVPVRLIRCARRGKGAAVRAGLLATTAEFVGFCDADMAADLSALDAVVPLLLRGHQVVIGSRAHPESDVESRHSAVRRIGAALFRAATRLVARGVRDTQCGFKFFHGPVARAAAESLRCPGFAFDPELLARCRALTGRSALEIPVRWRDVPGSTFSVRRHGVAAFAEIGLIVLDLVRGAVKRVPPEVQQACRLKGVAGMRVALVNWRDPWHPEAGGAERYAWEMAAGLRDRGAIVHYVTARAPGQARRERQDGIQIARMGGRFSIYPLVLAWLAARRRTFDAVIDCQNGIPFFTPLVMARHVTIVCVVHHVHDAQFGVHFPPVLAAFGRFLEGPAARLCYRDRTCVAVSDSTAAAMRSRLRWDGPIRVIHNGVAEGNGLARSAPADRGIGMSQDAQRIVMVGRLVAHKRAERVLDIARHLADAGVRIEIIGRGPQRDQLAGQIAASALGHVVTLRGFLPEEEKRAAVAQAALHVNTSQGEGWGLCVLEAAALGVPTVAYDVDGLRDAIVDGETGWLVGDDERIEDVAERALKEIADPERGAQISAACRAWAARFDWEHSAEQMAELLASSSGAA